MGTLVCFLLIFGIGFGLEWMKRPHKLRRIRRPVYEACENDRYRY